VPGRRYEFEETEFIVLDKAIQRKIPRRAPEFAGMLDQNFILQWRHDDAHVESCPAIAPAKKRRDCRHLELERDFIRNNEGVSEGSDDDLLATFVGLSGEQDTVKFIFFGNEALEGS
jgi:hypothetical protein